MSDIKLSENLFLEVAELNRLKKFIIDDGYKKLVAPLIDNFGIVVNQTNSNFKVFKKENTLNTVVINSGLAINSDLNFIVLNDSIEKTFDNDGLERFILISRAESSLESGTVSITSSGDLIGSGTKFTEVLRGLPNFPIKIKLKSNVNTSEYEIVRVVSDNHCVLSGSFTAEAGLNYSVIGTFTPGFEPLEENKYIYKYDSINLEIIQASIMPELLSGQYPIARLYWENEVIKVEDLRGNYLFNQNVTKNNSSYNNVENKIVTITNFNRLDNKRVELIINHGYQINSFQVVSNSTTDSLLISSGECNFLGNGNIPDGLFNGWLLLNRNNMLYSKITSNINKTLVFEALDTNMFNGSEDLVVIPDFNEIEYELRFHSTNFTWKPIYKKFDITNITNRVDFPIEFGIVSIEVKFRMLNNARVGTKFQTLSYSSFEDLNGGTVTTNGVIRFTLVDLNDTKNYS